MNIPEDWIKGYIDKLLMLAGNLPTGRMRDATLLRVDHMLDLVAAWREEQANRAAVSEEARHGD